MCNFVPSNVLNDITNLQRRKTLKNPFFDVVLTEDEREGADFQCAWQAEASKTIRALRRKVFLSSLCQIVICTRAAGKIC